VVHLSKTKKIARKINFSLNHISLNFSYIKSSFFSCGIAGNCFLFIVYIPLVGL